MLQEAADKVRRRWGYGSNTTNDPGPWERALRNPFRRRLAGARAIRAQTLKGHRDGL